MSDKVIRPPSWVRSAYENYLEAFRTIVEGANRIVSFPDRPVDSCFTESGKGQTVEFKWCLYLKDWPCRKLPLSKRLDVAVMALEEITRDSWQLKKSTVYLNYFVVSNATAALVQSLHYDFQEGGQSHHPFFHVQLTHEAIPESDLRSTGFDLQLKLQEPPNNCWVTTRIPTSDMTLASVLYCLVADHLGAVFFDQFTERVHSILDRLPPPNFNPLRNSIQNSSAHFKSSHWFAHMRDPAQQNN